MTKICSQTEVPQVDNTALDCPDGLKSIACLIRESATSYLGLPENTDLDTLIDAVISSLTDVRQRTQILEGIPPKVINSDTSISYTFSNADTGRIVTLENALAITATIPTNVVETIAIGEEIEVYNIGVGVVTITGPGVTILENVGGLTMAQGDARTLKKIATDTWVVKY